MSGLHFETSIDNGFEKGIDRMIRKVDELNNKVDNKTKETAASFDRLQTTVMATFSTVAMGAFVGKVIQVRSEIQSLEIAFNSMLQSKQASQKLMAEIVQTAATTPYSVIEIAGTAKKLMAFGESTESVITTTRRLGDVASATGSDLAGIALAYGQIMAKGKLQTQELNQMQERGIPVLAELAKMHKQSKEQTLKDIEAQKIGFDEVKQVIFNLTAEGGKFYNLMAENAKTLRGQVSNLGDQFDQMLNGIGEANNSVLSGGIQGLSLLIENWETIADTIGTVVAAYGAYKAATIAIAAVNNAGVFVKLATDIADVYKHIVLMTPALGAATAAQEAFNLAGWANPYALLAGGIAAVVAGLVLFVDWTDESEKALAKLQETISDTVAKQTAELVNLKASVNKANASDIDREKVINRINEAYAKELGHTVSVADGNMVLVESIDKIIARKKLQIDLAEKEKAINEKTARMTVLKDVASGKRKDTEAGFFGAFDSGKTINGTFVRQAVINEYETLNAQIAKLRAEISDSESQLLTASASGTGTEKFRTIGDIEAEIKQKQDAQKKLRDNDFAGAKKYNEDIKKLQEELDLILGRGKTAKIDRSASNTLLETEYTKRVTAINKLYAYDKTQAVEHQRAMLAEEADYLAKKAKLSGTDLERATIAQQQVANQQAQQRLAEKKTLSEMLEEYKPYGSKKKELEAKYEDEIKRLREAGKDAEAEIATERGRAALDQLEKNFLAQSEAYKKFIENDLPQIVEDGAAAIGEAMQKLNDSISTETDEGKLTVMAAEMQQLKASLAKLSSAPVNIVDKKSAQDTLDTLSEINDKVKSITELFAGDTALSDMTGAALALSGALLTAVQSAIALTGAITTLEAVSIVLVAVAAALTAVNALARVREKSDERKDKRLAAELRYTNAINAALIEQIALYKEGSELFASDAWGSALANLNAYNAALTEQSRVITGISADHEKIPELYRGQYTQKSEQIDNKTAAAQALATIRVKTRDRSGIANAIGMGDETASLLKLYPELVDAQGQLNKVILEQAIAEADVSQADKTRLQGLLDNLNTAEKAYAAFGSYIAGIFGGLGDSVAQAFQDAYTSGSDAMAGLEQSMAKMIESFSRDIIEFAFLQPLMDEVNSTVKDLGTKRAAGTVTNDQLQTGVIESLGAFYSGVNAVAPAIMQAYTNLDSLAAQAGFGSAFNAESSASAPADTVAVSVGAQVAQQITEQTGTEIVGRVNAIMLGVEKIHLASERAYELSVKKMAILNRIGDNTDYLPEIAANTRKTADRLGV